MHITFLSDKKLLILLHLSACALFFILPVYLIITDSGRDTVFIARFCAQAIIYVLLFYLNYFWLIPYLLFKNQKVQYYLIIISIVIAFFFANMAVNSYIIQRHENARQEEAFMKIAQEYRLPRPSRKYELFNYLFTCTLICGFSLGLRMSEKYRENEKRRKELEKESLNSELAFLKNQISPHFFFNTLNNIYSLIQINTEDAQNSVLKLSKLMRYLLYESEHGDTPLNREIDFMNNYIDLMRLRLSNKVSLSVSLPESTGNQTIPPLLFIPFIENAFKHGISYQGNSFISIEMRLTQSSLTFNCINSLAENGEAIKIGESGIGLENAKKRLALLFPGHYNLLISRRNSTFEISLNIDLQKSTEI